MSAVSAPPSITARDFYGALTIVWLFLTLIALDAIPAHASWRSYLLPIGTLVLLGLYARAWRRAQRSLQSPDSVKQPSAPR